MKKIISLALILVVISSLLYAIKLEDIPSSESPYLDADKIDTGKVGKAYGGLGYDASGLNGIIILDDSGVYSVDIDSTELKLLDGLNTSSVIMTSAGISDANAETKSNTDSLITAANFMKGYIRISDADTTSLTLPAYNTVGARSECLFVVDTLSKAITITVSDTTGEDICLVTGNDTETLGNSLEFDNATGCVLLMKSGISVANDSTWLVISGRNFEVK